VLALVLPHIDTAAGATVVIAPAVALYSLALRRGRGAQPLAGGERRQGRLGAHGGGHLGAPREPGQMQTVATARRQVSK
jgi:hypothetical protein